MVSPDQKIWAKMFVLWMICNKNDTFSLSMPVSSLLVYLLNASVKIKISVLPMSSFSHGEDVRFQTLEQMAEVPI